MQELSAVPADNHDKEEREDDDEQKMILLSARSRGEHLAQIYAEEAVELEVHAAAEHGAWVSAAEAEARPRLPLLLGFITSGLP